MLKTIRHFDIKGKRVLVRVDFNVPINNGKVSDDFRIRSALPTIQYCLKNGAGVVIMSHLGRPNGKPDPELSLIPVGETLAELLEMPIKFSHDCISEDARDISMGIRSGEIHLIENLRFHKGETDNDTAFSSLLAKHGQVYINDAFGTAHRAHASNVGVVKYFTHSGIGLLFEKELQYLQDTLKSPKRPLTMVLGGAKIYTKLQLIHRFVEEADDIIIGGGMVFTFLKAKGKSIGRSLVDDSMLSVAQNILQKAKLRSVKLHFPVDIIVAKDPQNVDSSKIILTNEIPNDFMGLDIGPKSVAIFSEILTGSKTIIWNGPMGMFEIPGFDQGSLNLAKALSAAYHSGAMVIIGGGDTAAAIRQFNMMDSVSHISTGGGASLELLSGNRLPAVQALEN
jgi:phosphoglycerate kinase